MLLLPFAIQFLARADRQFFDDTDLPFLHSIPALFRTCQIASVAASATDADVYALAR